MIGPSEAYLLKDSKRVEKREAPTNCFARYSLGNCAIDGVRVTPALPSSNEKRIEWQESLG
jgi:hypothetical protein